MAITRIKDSGTTPITDGTTYDPAESGSDQGVDCLILLRDSTSGGTSTDFQLNSVNFVQDQTILSQGLLSFTMYLTSGAIVEANIPASGTFDAQISGTATGEGGLVATVSGMLQSGTITSDMQLSTFANTTTPTFSVSAVAGDKITLLYESNGGTDSLPSDLSTGDTWVERATGPLTGAPLNQGKIWDVIVTGTVSSESIGGSDILSGNNSGTIGMKVLKGSVGGGPITGSGVLTSQDATMSGTALIEKTSSGVLVSQDATMAGTGTVSAPAITGSGALVSQDASMSGTGTVSAPPVTGSGSLASQSATMAGSGSVIVPTLDDVNTNEITTDGETGVTYTVTGFSTINGIKIKSGTAETDATGITASDFDIPNVSAYTIDTDGAPFTTASNAIVYEVTDGVAVASLAGTHNPILGWLVQEITGAVKTPGSVFENFIGTIPDTSEVYYPNADNTTVDATGILSTDSTSNIDMQYWDATLENWQPFSILISISGSGVLLSQAATMSGTGVVGSNIVGSGSLVSQSATMTGAGLIEKTSSGVLISQAATMSGTGVVGDDIVGNGVLISQAATMSGAGIRELTASGNLISQTATMSGSGARGLKSSGNLISQSATMSGEGTIPQAITGAGVLISQVATMSGQGDVPRDVTVKPQNTNTAGIRQNNTTRVGPRQPNTVRTFPK